MVVIVNEVMNELLAGIAFVSPIAGLLCYASSTGLVSGKTTAGAENRYTDEVRDG